MATNKTYLQFVQQVKQQILQSRFQAAKLVNRELIILYYNIGKMLSEKVDIAKWGSKVLENIAGDLQKELPGLRGFSHRNLKRMRGFYEQYSHFSIGPSLTAQLGKNQKRPLLTAQLKGPSKKQAASAQLAQISIGQLATAQLSEEDSQRIFYSISFTHHVLLMKIKNIDERLFYMQQSAQYHWTVTLLQHHIESNLYHQKGKLPNNFKTVLPSALAAHALDAFKDEYLLDFININPEDDERVLEKEIINNIKHFILSLGTGFSFIGNQYRLVVDEEEFFSDLLFFNRQLQSLVVIDLKKGKFKPEHAGKLNFYLNLLDEQVKLPHEKDSIGIILCKEKNNKVAEYAFKTIDKAMGVATYKTSKQLPAELKRVLPDVEALKKFL